MGAISIGASALGKLWPVITELAREKKLSGTLEALQTVIGNIEPLLANPSTAESIREALQDLGWIAGIV